ERGRSALERVARLSGGVVGRGVLVGQGDAELRGVGGVHAAAGGPDRAFVRARDAVVAGVAVALAGGCGGGGARGGGAVGLGLSVARGGAARVGRAGAADVRVVGPALGFWRGQRDAAGVAAVASGAGGADRLRVAGASAGGVAGHGAGVDRLAAGGGRGARGRRGAGGLPGLLRAAKRGCRAGGGGGESGGGGREAVAAVGGRPGGRVAGGARQRVTRRRRNWRSAGASRRTVTCSPLATGTRAVSSRCSGPVDQG